MSHMKKLIENDKTTVLFVSHDISSIKAMCSKAVLLENGYVKMFDKADKVAEEYFAARFEKKSDSTQQQKRIQDTNVKQVQQSKLSKIFYNDVEFKKTSSFQRIQNGKANFTNVVILDEEEKVIQQVQFGQAITVRCFVDIHEDIHNLSFGFHIRNRNGVEILYDDTVLQRQEVLWVKQNERYIVDWSFKLMLQEGNYNIAVVTSVPINLDIAEVDMCDFIPIAAQIMVESKVDKIYAAVFANSTLSIKNGDKDDQTIN